MLISIYEGTEAHSTGIAREARELEFGDLPSVITTTLWSPGVFRHTTWTDRNGAALQGMRRTSSNLERVEVLALDIDAGCTMEEARALFKDYSAIIAPTRHHGIEKPGKDGTSKPPCDRFRLILPLEYPIYSDADFKATWHRAEAICPAIDKACKDSARFFLPSLEVALTWTGKPFPVAAAEVRPAPAPASPTLLAPQAKLPLSKATKDFILYGAESGEWHHHFYRAAIDMKQQLYSFEEAEELLTKVTGLLDEEHDYKTLRDVYDNRAPKHPPRLPGEPPQEVTLTASDRYERLTAEQRITQAKAEREIRERAKANAVPLICSAFDGILSLQNGLYLFGAATGHGKSTTSANILAKFFIHSPDKHAFVISNEETSDDISGRVACTLLKKHFLNYREGLLPLTDTLVVDRLREQVLSRIEVVITTDRWDMTCLEDVQAVLATAAEADDIALVVVDYLQTVTHSKESPDLDPVQVSKRLGFYLKEYGRRAALPVVVFGQLKPKSEAPDFQSRFQNDRTISNHATAVVEVVPDFEAKITNFIVHKSRFGDKPTHPIVVRWDGGRYETITGESIKAKTLALAPSLTPTECTG